MAKARREFAPEFKREAVILLGGRGRPRTQIAAELGIHSSMVRRWLSGLNGGLALNRDWYNHQVPRCRALLCPHPISQQKLPGFGMSSTGRASSATC